jgi:hypothetical protein
MTRSYWLFVALILSGALALLNQWALTEYLYWRYEWFDILMHLLGGLAIGTFVAGLLYKFRPGLFLLGVVVLVVGWEVFEYMFGIPHEDNYVFDTALDLLMDTFGALVVYGIARTSLWRSK